MERLRQQRQSTPVTPCVCLLCHFDVASVAAVFLSLSFVFALCLFLTKLGCVCVCVCVQIGTHVPSGPNRFADYVKAQLYRPHKSGIFPRAGD